MFKESLQNLVSDDNPHHLIATGNKEIQHQTLEMVTKLSKDVFYEINQVDQQVQRMKQRLEQNGQSHGAFSSLPIYSNNDNPFTNNQNNLSAVNASGVLLGSAIGDPNLRSELREIRQSVELLSNQKANISDVCTLVDMKANQEDLEQAVCDIGQKLQDRYLPREIFDEWKQSMRFAN